VDNTLSAHQAWEVEKHLTGCDECTAEVRMIHATVQLLHAAPRRDTSDTFMASLHARLDTIDPTVAGKQPLLSRLRSWFFLSNGSFAGSRAPILSFGLAVCVLALLFTVHRSPEPPAAPPSAIAAPDNVHISIATSAGSPFSDPAADNLELRAAGNPGRAPASL
jgi:anti-sigma factor RsiW